MDTKIFAQFWRLLFWIITVFLCAHKTWASYDQCPDGQYGSQCLDCGHCDGTNVCNKVSGKCETGCQMGYMMPLCKSNCPAGKFGQNCAEFCGHCNQSATCDMITGVCPSQCEQWYAGDNKCQSFIKLININTLPKVLFVHKTWAMLELDIQQNRQLEGFYVYQVEYIHQNKPEGSFQLYSDFETTYDYASEKLTIMLKGLLQNTQYWFRIQIIRNHNGVSEAGSPSHKVKVSTLLDTVQASYSVKSNTNYSLSILIMVSIMFVLLVLVTVIVAFLGYTQVCWYNGGWGNNKMNRNESSCVDMDTMHKSNSQSSTVAFRL